MNEKNNFKKVNPYIRYRIRYLFFIVSEFLLHIISLRYFEIGYQIIFFL